MKIQLLGTGGYHPNEKRHTACLLLPEVGIVLDAGTSAFRIAEQLKAEQSQIDTLQIFITHAHLDHIIGLTFLLYPMMTEQIKTIKLYCDAKTEAAIKQHLFSQELFPVLPDFEWVILEEKNTIALPQNGTLSHIPLNHPGGGRGFRLDWKEVSFAYITDTTVDETYLDFIRGVDVLIHECYFKDDMAEWAIKTGHSHTTPVAQLAKQAEVKQLVLTHIDPHGSEDDPTDIVTAKQIFPNTIVAEDLMEIIVP